MEASFSLMIFGAETHHFGAHAAFDNVFQSAECAAADEQDVGGIHLDEILLGMFAPALGRYAGSGSLE